MKHLINRINSSSKKPVAQIRCGNRSFSVIAGNLTSQITIDGHDIISNDSGYDKMANLISDMVKKDLSGAKDATITAYICNEVKEFDSVLKSIKNALDSSVKIVTQSKEIPDHTPIKLNLEEAFAPEKFLSRIREFAQSLHDINETLRVCREDIISLTHGKLVDTMWGAKPMQQILCGLKNNIEENDDWDNLEFYVNMIMKSIERITHKMGKDLYTVCDEEKKVVNTVLIPNIIQGFEKIKGVISKVLMMLSNLVYIDEMFKKNTTYPASWFINGDIFEDIKLDYNNLVLFALKIPRIEQEIIYPLDMMRHSSIKK